MPKSQLLLWVGLLGVALTAGCVTTSEYPHVDAATARADSRLDGTWLLAKGKESTWLHIGPKTPQGQSLVVVHQDARPDHAQGGMGGHILAGPAGADQIASVSLEWEIADDGAPQAAEKVNWFVLRYRVDGTTLRLERLDDHATGKAVQARELVGQYEVTGEGKLPPAPHLQTPTVQLAAWLASGKAKWQDFGVWKRK